MRNIPQMMEEFDPDSLQDIKLTFGRADFKVEIFDGLIVQKGHTVIWEQSMFCSCISIASGQPQYDCPACLGKGYVYFSPKTTRMVVSSINGKKSQDKLGLAERGSIYATPLSTDNVGFRDRFIFPQFTMKFSEVVTRRVLGEPDKTRFPLVNMIRVVILNTEYYKDIHFTFEEGSNEIHWLPVSGIPSMNQAYSIVYDTYPRYIAINPIHEVRATYSMFKANGGETFVKLPKQFQAKREDFIEHGDI